MKVINHVPNRNGREKSNLCSAQAGYSWRSDLADYCFSMRLYLFVRAEADVSFAFCILCRSAIRSVDTVLPVTSYGGKVYFSLTLSPTHQVTHQFDEVFSLILTKILFYLYCTLGIVRLQSLCEEMNLNWRYSQLGINLAHRFRHLQWIGIDYYSDIIACESFQTAMHLQCDHVTSSQAPINILLLRSLLMNAWLILCGSQEYECFSAWQDATDIWCEYISRLAAIMTCAIYVWKEILCRAMIYGKCHFNSIRKH